MIIFKIFFYAKRGGLFAHLFQFRIFVVNLLQQVDDFYLLRTVALTVSTADAVLAVWPQFFIYAGQRAPYVMEALGGRYV